LSTWPRKHGVPGWERSSRLHEACGAPRS
jgi:hypothetical protein